MNSDDRAPEAAGDPDGGGLTPAEQFEWQRIVQNSAHLAAPEWPEVASAPEQVSTLTVRIALADLDPQVWRRLELAGDLTLEQAHGVLVEAMGWADSHLHRFWVGDDEWSARYFVTDLDLEEDEGGVHEGDVRLDQVLRTPGDRLGYTYDFGDNWTHTLELEAVAAREPGEEQARCTGGERACPPEDSGGISTYTQIADALRAGRLETELPEYAEWLPPGFDPDAFDLAATDRAVTRAAVDSRLLTSLHPEFQTFCQVGGEPVLELLRAAGEPSGALTDDEIGQALHQFLFLLDLAGDDGLELTAAGYLRPAVVRQIATEMGLDKRWVGTNNRENQTWPVAQLRQDARTLGLLRKRRDRLLVTRFGREVLARPRKLWDRLHEKLPAGNDAAELQAGRFVLLLAAAGRRLDRDGRVLLAQTLTDIGWRIGNGSVEEYHVMRIARETKDLLGSCGGYVDAANLFEPSRPARAGRVLARAALGLS